MRAEGKTDRVLPGGLLGFLDDFEYRQTGGKHLLVVRGWILGGDSRVRSVVVKRQQEATVSIPCGLPRPDVADAYPEDPQAQTSGFGGLVTVPRPNSGPEEVEICAVLESGREVPCFSRSYAPQEFGLTPSGRVRIGGFLESAARKALAAYRDGRLSFSPGKWLRDVKSHYRTMAASGAAPADLEQQDLGIRYLADLQTFFDSHLWLSWPQRNPRVSIILVLSERPELTLRCLRGLQGLSQTVEMIIVDNACWGDTSRLVERLDGVRIVRQPKRIASWQARNEAARMAIADRILFLSNDVQVLPGSLEAAVRTLESADAIGAVGAKLIRSDGLLKEAGGIVWDDGSHFGYGYGDDPQSPPYMYMRDVDYCSGAFLLTRRELFIRMGGFGQAPREDIDYCLRLSESGRRVVFDPRVVVNFESTSDGDPLKLPEKHHDLLVERSASRPRQRILVLDDRVPHFRHGAGFPRAVELIRTLDEIGHFVTFYPVTMPHEDWSEIYDDIPRTVEVIIGWGAARLRDFMKEREGHYDQIIVSRPHNMKTFRSELWKDGVWDTSARVIYDAEAIFSFREAEQRRLSGEPLSEDDVARLLSEEMGLTEGVHAVFSVTDQERDYFRSSGVRTVWTLGHTVTLNPTPRSFAERSSFLFVGAMSGTPNRDAVLWFCREIWPKFRSLIDDEVSFSIVGGQPPAEVRELPHVNVLGQVADLTPLYDRARIFVAPSRLAAGIPIKVQTAAAHGLPVVCTSILAEELGWHNEVELLVADDPEGFAQCCARLYSDDGLWARLRSNALNRVAQECSHQAFADTLAQALD